METQQFSNNSHFFIKGLVQRCGVFFGMLKFLYFTKLQLKHFFSHYMSHMINVATDGNHEEEGDRK